MMALLWSRSAKFLMLPRWESSPILTVGGDAGGTSSEHAQLYKLWKRDARDTLFLMRRHRTLNLGSFALLQT